MAEVTATVASTSGLHARPAQLFVQAAQEAGIPVQISKDGGDPLDATSILGVMALGAKHGNTVTLTADGDNADEVLAKLAEVIETNLDA